MLAESHRRQIAPGGGLVRCRGGIGRQLALWAGGRAWDWPEDPAGSRHDGWSVGRSVGLLGRERLSTTEPCSAVPASSALTRLSRVLRNVPGQTSRTQHYSCT